MSSLSCSSSYTDVTKSFKPSNGCSTERYLLRQSYLRSYPLMMEKKETKFVGNVGKRTKKWLKEKRNKYWRRFGGGDTKSKRNPGGSSYIEACLKLLFVCVAKVDVVRSMEENPKPSGSGIEKL